MDAYKFVIALGIISMVSARINAEVLELGASELHGKKDQPEAMTFISRARVDKSTLEISWRATDKIQQEIQRDVFLLPSHD